MSLKVLILEDDETLRKSLELDCKGAGHKVFVTDNIEEARGLALRERPDIIFLDQRIYGDSKAGTTLCGTLKGDGLTAKIVGIGQSITKAEWLAAGADYASDDKDYRELKRYIELVSKK